MAFVTPVMEHWLHQKRVHIASSDVANVETDLSNVNVEVDVASSMSSL